MLYTATVRERVVTLDAAEFHQGSIGRDDLTLALDSEWDGAEFTVVLFYRGRTQRGTSEIVGKRLWYGEPVDVPGEALGEAGELRVTVVGVWPNGDRIVTCEMEDGGEVCWSGAHDVDWNVDPGQDAIDALSEMVRASALSASRAEGAAGRAEEAASRSSIPEVGVDGQYLVLSGGAPAWGGLPAETDPSVPAWAKSATKPAYTAAEVGADPAGSAAEALADANAHTDAAIAAIPVPDVSAQIAGHDASASAHSDIRGSVAALSNRLGALADSDDQTLDQLSEVVAYIKDNRELIDAVTDSVDSKVAVALEGAKASGEFDGPAGPQGEQGPAGYTPQRGTDYWTEADVAEIEAYVDGSVAANAPDWAAADGGAGYIANKPTIVGKAGTGEASELFNYTAYNSASAVGAHAEGAYAKATGSYAHAEGYNNAASGSCAHAEGYNNAAEGYYSHVEGNQNVASGTSAHAEGGQTTAEGTTSHAEGFKTTASASYSHAEGTGTAASGHISHAEGNGTTAKGDFTHSEGAYTVAASRYQHVQGKYNVEDAGETYAHIVGNGNGDDDRSNAHTLDWSGNGWYAGSLFVGGASQADAAEVATKAYVDEHAGGAAPDVDAVVEAVLAALPTWEGGAY